jgi:hypothetical protein
MEIVKAVKCIRCGKIEEFSPMIKSEATVFVRGEGWVRGHGSAICPDCKKRGRLTPSEKQRQTLDMFIPAGRLCVTNTGIKHVFP